MDNLLARLNKAHSKYENEVDAVWRKLEKKIQFDFSIFYQQGDGFVMEFDGNNASLKDCLDIISNKGTLSVEDYLEICI